MQILKEKIRFQIIEAATEIFYIHGYEKTSMKKISEKASVSVSNIYNYYASKEILFKAIVMPVYDRISYFFKFLVDYEEKETLKPVELIQLLTKKIECILADDYKEIVLLLRYTDKEGKNYKEKFAQILEEHFIESTQKGKKADDLAVVFHIVALNFVEGFIQIAECYRNKKNITNTIEYFLTYHLAGMTPLIY